MFSERLRVDPKRKNVFCAGICAGISVFGGQVSFGPKRANVSFKTSPHTYRIDVYPIFVRPINSSQMSSYQRARMESKNNPLEW